MRLSHSNQWNDLQFVEMDSFQKFTGVVSDTSVIIAQKEINTPD